MHRNFHIFNENLHSESYLKILPVRNFIDFLNDMQLINYLEIKVLREIFYYEKKIHHN